MGTIHLSSLLAAVATPTLSKISSFPKNKATFSASPFLSPSTSVASFKLNFHREMATAAVPAVISWTRTGIAYKSGQTQRKSEMKVSYIRGLNSYGGLKAQNNKVVSMGLPLCTDQCFANVVMSLKGRTSGGGAITSTCNAVGEIFKIAAIMNALTLVGVAVGFVLLRIEASVEEAE
ncbi:hypothetical protein EUTSA_v10001257mg [Eutrema salsugineum]|uniref:Cytochrome b6-f complex subunit 7 n=2 Tax=Eutrema salsugineum TaxID=72664 RepID=V4N2S6_EUTSA|nr:hypothetical protein EUTSA_v10001257mg [Eutrema salsugineum]